MFFIRLRSLHFCHQNRFCRRYFNFFLSIRNILKKRIRKKSLVLELAFKEATDGKNMVSNLISKETSFYKKKTRFICIKVSK